MARKLRFLLAVPLALGMASSAQALTLTINSIATNAGNTANFLNNGVTDGRENQSAVQTLSAGGSVGDSIGANVSASTRYSAEVSSDSGVFTTSTRNATSDYSVTFTVNASGPWIYNVVINTRRTGSVTLVNDGSASAQASIGAVAGTLNAGSVAALGLAAGPSLNSNSGQDSPFNQTSTYTLSGLTGSNTYTLRFVWTANTNSSSGVTGGDEAAVRLGIAGTMSGNSADDYPGVGSRTQSNDGHFVTIQAVAVIPEPATAFLLGAGLAGLAALGRKRA